jgi:hypothetical protein
VQVRLITAAQQSAIFATDWKPLDKPHLAKGWPSLSYARSPPLHGAILHTPTTGLPSQ